MKSLFTTDIKPVLTCSECQCNIEPISSPSGSYLSFQPSICDDCLAKKFEIDRSSKINERLNNVRKIAVQRNLPEKFATEVQYSDFNLSFHKRFIDENQSFLISGEPESGKTHLAGWMFLSLLKEYPLIPAESFYYTSLSEIDELIRKDWKESEILSRCRTKYLFFQFGDTRKERMKNDEATAWIDTLFFKIIDYRYNKKLPTVWITRLKGLEAMSMYDNASISRIIETSIMIKMGDKKYRSKRAMKNESYNL